MHVLYDKQSDKFNLNKPICISKYCFLLSQLFEQMYVTHVHESVNTRKYNKDADRRKAFF